MSTLSLYVHIPFCKKRCNYCDFNTYAGMEKFLADYVMALSEEIQRAGRFIDQTSEVTTIYFGGGTPSLLAIDHVKQIIQSLHENFNISKEPEITFEVNPGTVSRDYLDALHNLGINRLSIGMQSANDSELKMMGRIHHVQDVNLITKYAKDAQFNNISLDLIFGLPTQTMESWRRSIHVAIQLQPQHISSYALTIEANTPLAKNIKEGNIYPCSDDLAADMYEWAMEKLSAEGYIHYEISNWAKIRVGNGGYQCAHNLHYWRNDPYIGLGAGAHSHYNHQRWENISDIPGYIEASKMNIEYDKLFARINIINNNLQTEMQEYMMLGLRLIEEGVSRQGFMNKYHEDMVLCFDKEIKKLINLGLVTWGNDGDRLKLTKRGIFMGNQVFMNFVN